MNKAHNFAVYPSWAKTSYPWEELPRLLSAPLRSGHLMPGCDLQYFLDCGYPFPPQPFSLLDGPVGGGIILWEADPHVGRGSKWLPIVILQSEADLSIPMGMGGLPKNFDAQVEVIEPHGGGFARPKIYKCAVTTEHVDEAGDEVYWVLCSRTDEKRIKGLGEITNWAAAFGLAVARLDDISPLVRSQFDGWFPDLKYHQIWFKVNGGGEELGFHFSVLVYLAYHIRWLAGKNISGMHLISQIEDRPNPILSWNWEVVRLWEGVRN